MNELDRWELVKQLHIASSEELKVMYSISKDEGVIKAITIMLLERQVWHQLPIQEVENVHWVEHWHESKYPT